MWPQSHSMARGQRWPVESFSQVHGVQHRAEESCLDLWTVCSFCVPVFFLWLLLQIVIANVTRVWSKAYETGSVWCRYEMPKQENLSLTLVGQGWQQRVSRVRVSKYPHMSRNSVYLSILRSRKGLVQFRHREPPLENTWLWLLFHSGLTTYSRYKCNNLYWSNQRANCTFFVTTIALL